jgi:predicted  nucleic acid-binding Zn-ribbon protein
MAQVEQLLKYQTEDSKLLQIERDAANSVERKNYVQAKAFLTKAPEKLEALDGTARELATVLEKLKKNYNEIAETLKEFENLDELVEGGADISFYKKSVTGVADQLRSIKGEINSLVKSIKDCDEEYQSLKKKTITVQEQYKQYKVAYQEYKNAKQAEIDGIQKTLDELAKGIDEDVMKKYQAKRSERIFPILCAVKGDRCSKCGMELSILGKEKLSSKGVTECDNCHRFLYKDR